MHTIYMHTKSAQVGGAAGRLKEEMALRRGFHGRGEAAFLAIVRTWQRLELLGREFFPRHGITDVQFNVLMALWDYRDRALAQHEVAGLLMVNRASAGGVLARIERAGWIERRRDPGDTRIVRVRLTPAGVAKLHAVRAPYYRVLDRVFRDSDPCDATLAYLDLVRSRIAEALGPAPTSSGDPARGTPRGSRARRAPRTGGKGGATRGPT